MVFATNDGERYEAEWSIRLTRNGNYKTPERTLKQLAPNKQKFDKAEIQDQINLAVGLTYEQFTRTVILAQNSFSNFLKAKTADKAVLLEKLTGTEVYGAVSEQIYQFTNDAGILTRDLENQIQGMMHDCLEPEQLQQGNGEKTAADGAKTDNGTKTAKLAETVGMAETKRRGGG